MKKLLSLIGVFLLGLFLFACKNTQKVEPAFDGQPTAVKTTVEGEILLNAKAKAGVVHYAVYASGEKTAAEVKEAKDALKKGSSAAHSDVKLALTAGETYVVFFVVEEKNTFSDVVKVSVTTHKEESSGTTVNFGSIAVISGDADGSIKVNMTTQGVGTIAYVLIKKGETAPTAEQIVAGVDYDEVVVVHKDAKASFANHIISDLTPGSEYTLYAVVHDGDTFSTVRNVNVVAKETVVVVDKGSGTEDDPYIITTIEDLEQVGQGSYAVTGSEWNMDNYYELGNDIDLTSKYGEGKLSWPVLGADAQGSRFTGHFDGKGFKIIGLYIGIESEAHNYRALFAASEKGSVMKNVIFIDPVINGVDVTDNTSTHATGVAIAYSKSKLENIQVVNGNVKAGSRVGGLVGRIYEEGDMTNVYVEAVVHGDNRVGGIAGVVDIADATPNPIVWRNIVFVGEVYGGSDYTGGFSGYVRGIDLANAWMTGYVEGDKNVGGVLGFYQKRGGNNNVTAKVDKVVVKATVVGKATDTRIGLVIGQKSASNLGTPEAEALFLLGDTYHVQGSQVENGGHGTVVDGELITLEQAKSAAFYQALFIDFDTNWVINEGQERPVIKDTLDEGKLLSHDLPLILIDDIKTGDGEYQINVKITSNDTSARIYYIITESETATQDDILTPGSGIESGSGINIDSVRYMEKGNHTYYVHYFAKSDMQESEVVSVMVKSAPEAQLTFNVTASMGELEGGVDLAFVDASHEANIYYLALLATQEAPTVVQIKEANNVLATTATLSLAAGETYKVYFYGEKLQGENHSDIVVREVMAKPAASAPFEIVTTKLEPTDVRGELRLEVVTSHVAEVKYIIQLATEADPTTEKIKTDGTVYSDVALLQLVGGAGTEYKVFVVATYESEDKTSTAAATTRRDLYNGETPASQGPFNIYHLEDLEDFASVLDANRRKANLVFHTDIDMSETYGEGLKNWTPYGTNTFKYVGTIEGNNHTINGLYVHYLNPNNNEGVGFIGTTDNGFKAYDLTFTNVNITGNNSIGTLAGYTKATHIKNIHVIGGTVTALNADSRVGGLLGRLNANSGTDVVENSSTNVTVTGIKAVGGVVGHVDYTADNVTGLLTIKNVIAYGDVVGTGNAEQIGGVVGYLRATLENGVAYGNVTGVKNVGNLVGYTQNRILQGGTNTTPYASITKSYSFSASENPLIGYVQEDRGPIAREHNFQVVDTVTDPTNEISLADVLNTSNWGTTVYLDPLVWEVVDNKLVLK